MKLALTILLLVVDLFLIAVILLQEGKTAGINGSVSGAADTFLSKNKAKSLDAKLARWTKWVAILWIVITMVLSLISGGRFFCPRWGYWWYPLSMGTFDSICFSTLKGGRTWGTILERQEWPRLARKNHEEQE